MSPTQADLAPFPVAAGSESLPRFIGYCDKHLVLYQVAVGARCYQCESLVAARSEGDRVWQRCFSSCRAQSAPLRGFKFV
jgi:hypothetical protein